jgi:hypothetical protein
LNCTDVPTEAEEFAGVTARDFRTGAAVVTVNVVEPVTEPEVAWIVLLPGPTPLAKPVLLIVPTEVLEEVQLTEFVRFWVLPSLYLPVAVNCCVLPLAIDGFVGVTAIDTKLLGAPGTMGNLAVT